MTKLLFLDKDGTLTDTRSGNKFVNAPWDQKPIAGVPEALDRYRSEGWEIVIISNQAGVAAGHKSLEDAIAEMRFALELFPQIQEAYFCPDFAGQQCWRVWGSCDEAHRVGYDPEWLDVVDLGLQGQFRKPAPGMLKLAISHHSAEEVLYVGDRSDDEGAAIAAGVNFLWAEPWRSAGLR